MNPRLILVISTAIVAVAALCPRVALAQYGGGSMPGMGPGGGQQPNTSGKDHDEGPAEAAPDEGQSEEELEPLGAYQSGQQRSKIIDLDGYFRFRTDWLHKLDLGQGWYHPEQADERPPPFPRAIDCGKTEGGCSTKTLKGANLRLRLEPTINVTDQVQVMAQIDVLDNLVLGSTPESLANQSNFATGNDGGRIPILSTTQDAQESGRNSLTSSIRAKRVWGQIDSEFGRLLFGRMPWHWGRGMFFNQGGNTCLDCNGGTTVDRIMGMTSVFGHQLSLGWDFGGSGRTLAMTPLGTQDIEAMPLDLSPNDDVFQLVASFAKRDDDASFRARAARGEVAVNYGFQLVYKSQKQDVTGRDVTVKSTSTQGTSELAGEDLTLSVINAYLFMPDLWFKLGWKALTIEFEGAAVLGKIKNGVQLRDPDSDNATDALSIQQAGFVLNTELSLFKNSFFVGFETGGATGDQAEDTGGYLNNRWRRPLQGAGDKKITNFNFSPQYHVDQILFRRILGTVSNAVYFKPQIAYWLNLQESKQIGLQGSVIYSFAPIPVSTPGNKANLGIETNAGVTYRNSAEGFYAGVTWGVMWPLAGLKRPAGIFADKAQGASTAQVIRTFLGIQF